jgi:hypothetical protein
MAQAVFGVGIEVGEDLEYVFLDEVGWIGLRQGGIGGNALKVNQLADLAQTRLDRHVSQHVFRPTASARQD